MGYERLERSTQIVAGVVHANAESHACTWWGLTGNFGRQRNKSDWRKAVLEKRHRNGYQASAAMGIQS